MREYKPSQDVKIPYMTAYWMRHILGKLEDGDELDDNDLKAMRDINALLDQKIKKNIARDNYHTQMQANR